MPRSLSTMCQTIQPDMASGPCLWSLWIRILLQLSVRRSSSDASTCWSTVLQHQQWSAYCHSGRIGNRREEKYEWVRSGERVFTLSRNAPRYVQCTDKEAGVQSKAKEGRGDRKELIENSDFCTVATIEIVAVKTIERVLGGIQCRMCRTERKGGFRSSGDQSEKSSNRVSCPRSRGELPPPWHCEKLS